MDVSPMDTDNFDQELCQHPETDSFDLAIPNEPIDSPGSATSQNLSPKSAPDDVVMTFKGMDISHEAMDVDDEENDTEDALRPIAVLIDELAREDLQARLNAMQQLTTISRALGPVRTREELIPYLTDMIDDDDEILMVIIEELFGLIEFVGGFEHLHHFISPYERLCVVEERIIRDAAVEKLSEIVSRMPADQYASLVIPLLERLCESDWHTARVSGTSLIGKIFDKVPAGIEYTSGRRSSDMGSGTMSCREAVDRLFVSCCKDDIPVVRRACIETIGDIVSSGCVGKDRVLSHYVPLFQKLVVDSQDNVRVLAPQNVIKFGNILSQEECSQHLIFSIRPLILDQSWRVRYIVADHYLQVCNLVTRDVVERSFVDSYIGLLKDQEAEVRAAACAQLPKMSELIGLDNSGAKLLPLVADLVKDPNKHTRAALASVLMEFCALFDHETMMNDLLPHILRVLKDEFSSVRLHIISKLNVASSRISPEVLEQSLIPAIKDLAKDSDWRVRMGIIERCPALAKHLGKNFFDNKLLPLCSDWLGDQVAQVRRVAADNFTAIAREFGMEYTMSRLVPVMEEFEHKPHYLHRMICLVACQKLSQYLGAERSTVLVDVMCRLLEDPVPNVRFKACQLLQSLGETGSLRDVQHCARLIQTKCIDDADVDVRHFAHVAVRALTAL